MTPKMTALRNTLAILAAGIATSIGVALAFTYLSAAQLGIGFAAIGMLIIAHLVYEIELAKAEYRKSMKDLKD
jgi:hypothetical protein